MYKKYDEVIKGKLSNFSSISNWEQVLADHREHIAIIQHERLIHLLVTIFVGIAMLLCSLAAIITEKLILTVLALPLMILFLAYIFHYWFLENTTQRWYTLTEKIKEHLSQ